MSEFKIELADVSPCYFCSNLTSVKETHCSTCHKELPGRINTAELLLGFVSGRIIDVRAGGLVLGRDEPEDDIPVLTVTAPGIMEASSFMQGGEFIVNAVAGQHNRKRLLEINSYKESPYQPLKEIPITRTTRIYNTNAINPATGNLAVLIQTGQFIANRGATRKYLKELEEINNSHAPNLG